MIDIIKYDFKAYSYNERNVHKLYLKCWIGAPVDFKSEWKIW